MVRLQLGMLVGLERRRRGGVARRVVPRLRVDERGTHTAVMVHSGVVAVDVGIGVLQRHQLRDGVGSQLLRLVQDPEDPHSGHVEVSGACGCAVTMQAGHNAASNHVLLVGASLSKVLLLVL